MNLTNTCFSCIVILLDKQTKETKWQMQ
jgi:hypothetical protein